MYISIYNLAPKNPFNPQRKSASKYQHKAARLGFGNFHNFFAHKSPLFVASSVCDKNKSVERTCNEMIYSQQMSISGYAYTHPHQ